MPISDYSTTASENDTAGSVNFAEGQNPSTVNNSARQVMADIRAHYNGLEFRDWGHTVTQTSGTQFQVATDVTAIYVVGRRIKCVDATTLYGYISASSYGAPNTTVTVVLDSGSLSGSLTSVELGLEPTYPGLPNTVTLNAGTQTLTNKTLTTPKVNEAVNLTATSTELNILDGATLTTAELNYVDGVTSAIQTQMDLKAPLASPSLTGSVTFNGVAGNRTIILSTPETITTTPTTGAWTTVNNTTLATATATAAILRIKAHCTAGSAATTDYAQADVYIRETGSALGLANTTEALQGRADCNVVGQTAVNEQNTEFTVSLDGSYDFDYYVSETSSGTPSFTYAIMLIGYIQDI